MTDEVLKAGDIVTVDNEQIKQMFGVFVYLLTMQGDLLLLSHLYEDIFKLDGQKHEAALQSLGDSQYELLTDLLPLFPQMITVLSGGMRKDTNRLGEMVREIQQEAGLVIPEHRVLIPNQDDVVTETLQKRNGGPLVVIHGLAHAVELSYAEIAQIQAFAEEQGLLVVLGQVKNIMASVEAGEVDLRTFGWQALDLFPKLKIEGLSK